MDKNEILHLIVIINKSPSDLTIFSLKVESIHLLFFEANLTVAELYSEHATTASVSSFYRRFSDCAIPFALLMKNFCPHCLLILIELENAPPQRNIKKSSYVRPAKTLVML